MLMISEYAKRLVFSEAVPLALSLMYVVLKRSAVILKSSEQVITLGEKVDAFDP